MNNNKDCRVGQSTNDDGNVDFDINDCIINGDLGWAALITCTLMSTMLTMMTTSILLTDTVVTTVMYAAF